MTDLQEPHASATKVMNQTISCQYIHMLTSYGVWNGHNPFQHTFPVLMVQFVVIFTVTRIIYALLRPFRQNTITANIIGGILIGPSILGQNKIYFDNLFPMRGRYILRTFSEFGLMLHAFVLGVQVDFSLVRHISKKAVIIATSSCLVPLMFGSATFGIIQQKYPLDPESANAVPRIVFINSLTSFLVTTGILKELKMLNSELGRLASSMSMVNDILIWMLGVIISIFGDASSNPNPRTYYAIPIILSYYMMMLFLLRPLIIWIANHTEGESMKQSHFIAIICIVMALGVVGTCFGQHTAFTGFILGLCLPDGPPLGTHLVQKLDLVASGFLLPIFCATSGIRMEGKLLRGGSAKKLELITVITYLGKFTGAFLPSLCFGMSILKSLCLASIMCCRGITEVAVYGLWKDKMDINGMVFAVSIVNMVIVTVIATSIVGYLYDPSRRYMLESRKAILKSKQNNLRMLVCINKEENVNPIINLLEVSSPIRSSPITAFVLQLIELKGSVTAFLKPQHQQTKSIITSSAQIVNAFNQFQRSYHGNVVVQHFTTIAPYASMHDDICTLALDKRVSIIIVPFYKQWGISGMVETSDLSIRTLNRNVLDKAPCSVGVLVHRRPIKGNRLVLTSKSMYDIVMLFLGGADDREALAYSKRMIEHQNARLTVVWIRTRDYNISSNETMVLGIQVMSELRDSEVGKHIIYKEETVEDGIGTIQVIQSLMDNFDLFIVGKNHNPDSEVLLGLTAWLEYPELGIIGDTLVNINDNFSVLVVQEQPERFGHREFSKW